MIALTSVWKLKNGLPPELAEVLKNVAPAMRAEPGTLLYIVHNPAPFPLDADLQPLVPPPAPILPAEQQWIEFFEIYRDAQAFSDHVNGPVFTKFREENIHHFIEKADKPGWADSTTTFLDPLSATIKRELVELFES